MDPSGKHENRQSDDFPALIEVRGLGKNFGEIQAVDDVSFEARGGEIFGLLGPNGAGKSTTIGCISGLLKPSSGEVRLLGYDVVTRGPESRRSLGVVPQELAIYEDLSARENLKYWASAYGLRGKMLEGRVQAVLSAIGLTDRATEPVSRFSGGMKRRLNFGCSVVHEPEILLLDEPTVGVDPQSRERLLDLVRDEVARGTCVLYTTHYMEEAQVLCDRLAIIDHGKIIASGTLEDLRHLVGEKDIVRMTGVFEPTLLSSQLSRVPQGEILQLSENSLHLALPDASQRLSEVFRILSASGASVHQTVINQPNLESLFIKLTGKELRE